MKRMIIAAAAAILISGLTACSDAAPSASITQTADSSEAVSCGMKIPLPEGWEALTGDGIYDMLFEGGGEGFKTAEELKESYEDNGMSYLLYAESPDRTAVLTLTALKITPDENTGEQLTLEEYARTNHNNSVFTYQASGMSLRNTDFSEKEIAGTKGWLSACEVLSGAESEELLMGQSEFTFEYSGCFCSLQTYYQNTAAGEEIQSVISGISAEK